MHPALRALAFERRGRNPGSQCHDGSWAKPFPQPRCSCNASRDEVCEVWRQLHCVKSQGLPPHALSVVCRMRWQKAARQSRCKSWRDFRWVYPCAASPWHTTVAPLAQPCSTVVLCQARHRGEQCCARKEGTEESSAVPGEEQRRAGKSRRGPGTALSVSKQGSKAGGACLPRWAWGCCSPGEGGVNAQEGAQFSQTLHRALLAMACPWYTAGREWWFQGAVGPGEGSGFRV